MNPFRHLWSVLVVGLMLGPESLPAQSSASFAFAKQYSADVITTNKQGVSLESKMYVDDGRLWSETNVKGTSKQAIIVRPDHQKFYQVMFDRKTVTETPMNSGMYKKIMGPFSPETEFELVGPAKIDGMNCTKYKGTFSGGKVFFIWVNKATQLPLKVVAEDNSITIRLKNYNVLPQDATQFVLEPPADFNVIHVSAVTGGAQ